MGPMYGSASEGDMKTQNAPEVVPCRWVRLKYYGRNRWKKENHGAKRRENHTGLGGEKAKYDRTKPVRRDLVKKGSVYSKGDGSE